MNTNTRQLPFCIAGALFIYMGVSRIIGSVVSSIIYGAIYGLDMDNLLRNMFSFSNMLQISLFIGLGVFLLIRKLPIVTTILFGVISMLNFISIFSPSTVDSSIDCFFAFCGYTVLCLLSLGVFTNFKAFSKVWFLPIILLLISKPLVLITTIRNLANSYRPSFIPLLNLFSTLTKTAVLAVAVILLCKWYKKVIASLPAKSQQPVYAQPVYAQPVQQEPVEPIYVAPVSPIEEELKKYKDLYEKGLISEEEYKEKKAELLKL